MSLGWYPIVNDELCNRCGICFDFCSHSVYEWSEEEGPIVIQSENCIHGCHGCENQCSSQAISYYGDLPGKKTGGAFRINL